VRRWRGLRPVRARRWSRAPMVWIGRPSGDCSAGRSCRPGPDRADLDLGKRRDTFCILVSWHGELSSSRNNLVRCADGLRGCLGGPGSRGVDPGGTLDRPPYLSFLLCALKIFLVQNPEGLSPYRLHWTCRDHAQEPTLTALSRLRTANSIAPGLCKHKY
jgi:hypothetical protein